MDNSLSKALIMVGSVLLAMIVMAFAAHAFMKIGGWATTQDDEVLIAQKEEFNREYEVYDKNLMYGVDVISCLNKALSNNEKITNRSVVNGNTYDESYEVRVKVTLTKTKTDTNQLKPLEESITVSYRDNTGKEYDYISAEGPKDGNAMVKLSDMNRQFQFLNKSYKNISKFKENTNLVTQTETCDKLKNVFEFNITKDESGTNEKETRELLSLADTVSETIKNTDSKTNAKGKGEGWTKAEFKSALYDLKTRRFRCTSLTYSDIGRVNYIEFEEI